MDKILKLKNNLYNLLRITDIINLIIISGEIVRLILYFTDVLSKETSLIWAIGSLLGVVLCVLTSMMASINTNHQLIDITNERVEEFIKMIEDLKDDNKL